MPSVFHRTTRMLSYNVVFFGHEKWFVRSCMECTQRYAYTNACIVYAKGNVDETIRMEKYPWNRTQRDRDREGEKRI